MILQMELQFMNYKISKYLTLISKMWLKRVKYDIHCFCNRQITRSMEKHHFHIVKKNVYFNISVTQRGTLVPFFSLKAKVE